MKTEGGSESLSLVLGMTLAVRGRRAMGTSPGTPSASVLGSPHLDSTSHQRRGIPSCALTHDSRCRETESEERGFIHGVTFDYTKALRWGIHQEEIILQKEIEKMLEN